MKIAYPKEICPIITAQTEAEDSVAPSNQALLANVALLNQASPVKVAP